MKKKKIKTNSKNIPKYFHSAHFLDILDIDTQIINFIHNNKRKKKQKIHKQI